MLERENYDLKASREVFHGVIRNEPPSSMEMILIRRKLDNCVSMLHDRDLAV